MSSPQMARTSEPASRQSSVGLGERAVIDRLNQLSIILPAMAREVAVARREAARLRRENAELEGRLSH